MEPSPDKRPTLDLRLRILKMRESGASWQEIAKTFDITRQRARYAYQLAQRDERRSGRPGST
jgi:transcriptional regulator